MRSLITAAGLTCALWDNVLTFRDELECIWKRNLFDVTRLSFIFIRYVNLAAMLYVAYGKQADRVDLRILISAIVTAGLRPPLDTTVRYLLIF